MKLEMRSWLVSSCLAAALWLCPANCIFSHTAAVFCACWITFSFTVTVNYLHSAAERAMIGLFWSHFVRRRNSENISGGEPDAFACVTLVTTTVIKKLQMQSWLSTDCVTYRPSLSAEIKYFTTGLMPIYGLHNENCQQGSQMSRWWTLQIHKVRTVLLHCVRR